MNPVASDQASQWRLFVALPIPMPVQNALGKLQSQWRAELPGRCVRWTRPGGFHLTLKFLGDVPVASVDPLIASLRESVRCMNPPALRCTGIGFFPNARRPRVVWAGVGDTADDLPKLQQAVETASSQFTHEPAGKPFSGHVTLGRCEAIRRSESEALERLAEPMRETVFGAWTADHVELIRSDLQPGGPRYTVLAAIPLAGDAASGKNPPHE